MLSETMSHSPASANSPSSPPKSRRRLSESPLCCLTPPMFPIIFQFLPVYSHRPSIDSLTSQYYAYTCLRATNSTLRQKLLHPLACRNVVFPIHLVLQMIEHGYKVQDFIRCVYISVDVCDDVMFNWLRFLPRVEVVFVFSETELNLGTLKHTVEAFTNLEQISALYWPHGRRGTKMKFSPTKMTKMEHLTIDNVSSKDTLPPNLKSLVLLGEYEIPASDKIQWPPSLTTLALGLIPDDFDEVSADVSTSIYSDIPNTVTDLRISSMKQFSDQHISHLPDSIKKFTLITCPDVSGSTLHQCPQLDVCKLENLDFSLDIKGFPQCKQLHFYLCHLPPVLLKKVSTHTSHVTFHCCTGFTADELVENLIEREGVNLQHLNLCQHTAEMLKIDPARWKQEQPQVDLFIVPQAHEECDPSFSMSEEEFLSFSCK